MRPDMLMLPGLKILHQNMKNIFVLLFLSLHFAMFAQTKREAKKVVEEQTKEGWDIVLPIEERTPKNQKSLKRMAISEMTNWGKEYLLPNNIRQRMTDECKYPVVLKIADTGGKIGHVFLQEGQLPGASFTGEPNLEDGQGHSTHVCGIACANEIGVLYPLVVRGIVKWKPLKVLNNDGSGQWGWLTKALDSERDNDKSLIGAGVGVVYNGSLGGGSVISTLDAALGKSVAVGVIPIFASGNTGASGVQYPGVSTYTLACASIDQNLKRSSFSTMGKEVDNAMPGGKILSTYSGNTFATLSGTSMATPFLSAAACVAISKWGPTLHNLEKMRSYLAWASTDIEKPGRDDLTGWGACLIESVLDKNPANMPGVTPPTDPPKRDKRTLNFVFGPYPLKWHPNIKIDPTQHSATITRLEISFDTELDAMTAYAQAKGVLATLYANRTIIVFPTNDFADVTRDEMANIEKAFTKAGYVAKVSRMDASEAGANVFWLGQ